MANEENNQAPNSESAEEAQSKHVATRRKLLKAGLAGAPVIVTMRSGTAWAVSVCFGDGPTEDMANTGLDDLTGRANILAFVGDATDEPPGPTAEGDTPAVSTDIDYQIYNGAVSWTDGPESRKDFYYLAAVAPSCYQSFCGPGGTGSGDGCNFS